eukprot:CAMPEP_0206412160 /NCGR_PEP_ID=MMETSP0294-20121207/33789_1 /ASSEMBLY_ACC=CAM_ASM_000327 /TAXON_ID=39354 /ORGANISM="Heterosigma akashiwo, Strain CCMP2393" /LENGTH=47 /DNA_ID= /DNA_START= /DNA_END= /DNA_ORIENTATION=
MRLSRASQPFPSPEITSICRTSRRRAAPPSSWPGLSGKRYFLKEIST